MFDSSEDLSRRLVELHEQFREAFPALCRVAVALYDADTDFLRTFIHSTHGPVPLRLYEARLSEVPSLQILAESGSTRVIPDLEALPESCSRHSSSLRGLNYRSSYTVPIRQGETFYGFLFFDSQEPGYFTTRVVAHLAVYAQLISLLVISEMVPVRTLKGAIQAARVFSRHRDEETGEHLERMSRYARLMATRLAGERNLPDWYVEYLFRFAPLHDVGKIGIPDAILLKPGRLDPDELEIMRTHVTKGLELIDGLISSFGLDAIPHVAMLRNIVGCHHESLDGTGYPRGLKGDAIPLEARITAIADVFDALTSRRPYKGPWSNADAAAFLREHAGTRFDPQAVEALLGQQDEIEAIQHAFREDEVG
ncbi:HD domain-containing phosphohydrolase [Pararhodospirillum oryzae]|uniref:Transcriptional regulator n=1 Tax=Pararhodospirillum oryzae TaxID=478448 RepID=A0A512H8A2_9PROT|nr:HD domain-containing phosphohydrolase [Pararhodospirillum oryzae]GEO81630.1 transcriptional regulator [Pararhodospirillum oryzae]